MNEFSPNLIAYLSEGIRELEREKIMNESLSLCVYAYTNSLKVCGNHRSQSIGLFSRNLNISYNLVRIVCQINSYDGSISSLKTCFLSKNQPNTHVMQNIISCEIICFT